MKQKTPYECSACLVGSEMCVGDRGGEGGVSGSPGGCCCDQCRVLVGAQGLHFNEVVGKVWERGAVVFNVYAVGCIINHVIVYCVSGLGSLSVEDVPVAIPH